MIVVMLFSLSSKSYAINYMDVKDENFQNILDVLASYNIINGYNDNTFRPGNCVTRAEAAKIIVSLLGYEDLSLGITSEFSDMKNHWAGRYAEVTNALNLIVGFDDNTFRPNEYLPFDEAIKIIINILGYSDEFLKTNSIENTMDIAARLNLLDNINNLSEYITRDNIAYLVYNSLSCNTVSFTNSKLVTNNKTLFDNIGNKEVKKITDDFALEHTEYDLSEYLLNTYDVYYDKNQNVVLVNNPRYETISGYIKSALPSKDIFISDKYGNTKRYNINDADIILNGMEGKIKSNDIKNSYAKLIVGYNSKIIGVVLSKPTDIKIINLEDIYIENSNTFAGKKLPMLNGYPDFKNIIVTGDASSLADIKVDDVVYFYETKELYNNISKIKLDVIRNNVSGIYKGTHNKIIDTFYNIDDSYYKLDSNYVINETPMFGDNIKALLNEENNIIDIKIEKYAQEPKSYGYVLSIIQDTFKLPKITILDVNGKKLTYYLKENCGYVKKTNVNNNIFYECTLSVNDFIKYDLLDNTTIKVVEKQNNVSVIGNFNCSNNTISNTYSITDASYLLLNKSYTQLHTDGIGYYIEGNAIVEKNIIKLMIVNKNIVNIEIKDDTTTITEPVIQQPSTTTYTGTLYGAIKNFDQKNNAVTLYNYNYIFTSNDNLVKYINNYKNSFVKIKVINNIISEVSYIKPEVTISNVTGVYKGKLQIDNKSFVEYSDNVKVYICTRNNLAEYTSFKVGTISDVIINSRVEFFITDNKYNGVVNVIIVYK